MEEITPVAEEVVETPVEVAEEAEEAEEVVGSEVSGSIDETSVEA